MLTRKIWLPILFTLIVVTSCAKFKQLYNHKFGSDGNLKISYSSYRGHTTFILSLSKNNGSSRYEIYEVPKRYAIQKYSHTVHYMAVTDTTGCKLKCLDFQFLDKYSTPYVLATFEPMSEEDKKILHVFSRTLQKKKPGHQLKEEEIDRLLGWVKIYF